MPLPAPEALFRLRPWLLRILLVCVPLALGIGIVALLQNGAAPWRLQLGWSCAALALCCAAALGALKHALRAARTGPALIGLALAAAAAILTPAMIWLSPGAAGGLDGLQRSALIALTGALSWGAMLAVLTPSLGRSQRPVQRAAAAACLLCGGAIILPLASSAEPALAWPASAALALLALLGALLTSILAHARRAGLLDAVAMTHVASVPRSAAFYRALGFTVRNSFHPPDAPEPTWAWLESPGGAKLMITRASAPVIPAQQAVMFYLYCDDLPARHSALRAAGLAVGPIERPFFAPRGQFRLTDPDGYTLMVMHA